MTQQRSQQFILSYCAEGMSSYLHSIPSAVGGLGTSEHAGMDEPPQTRFLTHKVSSPISTSLAFSSAGGVEDIDLVTVPNIRAV